jgi:hypothetical protein
MAEDFAVSATPKGGAIGEVLLTEHKRAVYDYFSEWCLDSLSEQHSDWLPDEPYHISFDINRPPHSYDVSINGAYASWYPDGMYALRFTPKNRSEADFESYSVDFPIEVKTGTSAELSDNQRAVMATLEQQPNATFPLRVRVDVSELPERFSVTPHLIQHTGDTPLPEYTTDSTEQPNSKTNETENETASLDDFGHSSQTNDGEVPDKILTEMKAADREHSGGFSIDDVADQLSDEYTRDDVADALDQLAMDGTVYQPDDDLWRTI